MKSNYIETIVLLLLILFISAASALCYNIFFTIGVLSLFSYIAFFKRKIKDNGIIIGVICFFLIVDLIHSLYAGESFRITRIFPYLYPIILSYLCLKICGRDTFFKLERIIYFLTVLSLGLFVLQLLLPALFERMAGIFSSFLAEPYLKRDPTAWYAFIYRYIPPDRFVTLIRNSGYMWEPGAFAWISLTMLFFRWMTSGIRLKDKHVLVYLLAIVSTFSTAGYLALLGVGIIYILHLKSLTCKYILLSIFLIGLPAFFGLDFIGEKIDSYLVDTDEGMYGYHEETDVVEYNRYMYFLYVLAEIGKYPLGYGTHAITDPTGLPLIAPNGLANILYHWGVIGLCFFLYALNRFYRNLNSNNKWFDGIIATVATCILLFSNPAHANPLVFLLVLYPFMFKNKTYANSGSL